MDVAEVVAREAIRATLSRYTLAGDRGRLDALAQCFTEDGVLEVQHAWIARGRKEILEQTGGAMPGAEGARDHPLLRHVLGTQGIELVSASEARAWTYFSVFSERGPDHMGRYIDRLKRIGEEWLIAHRRVAVEWYAANTVYPEHARRLREVRDARVPDGD